MKTETVTLPAYFASPLINDDWTGCTDSDVKEIRAWIRENPHYGPCLSCSDYPQITRYNGLLSECLDYTFPVIYAKD